MKENFHDDCALYVIISGTVNMQFFGTNPNKAIWTF